MSTEPHAPEIVPYTPQDLNAVLDCFCQLEAAENAVEPNRRTGLEVAKEYFEMIYTSAMNNDGIIFVSKQGNEVTGLIILLIEANDIIEVIGKHAVISDIVVKESFRGQGIATCLMLKAEEFAKAKGVDELRVTVLAKNIPALQLYQKTGYQSQEITLSKSLRL
jgi:ribosomal protein S18 acetylase RimI-like enzyme